MSGLHRQKGSGHACDGLLWNASRLAQEKLEMTNMDMKLGTTLKIKGKIASDADG